MNEVLGYLGTAIILTMCIPIFGCVMSVVVKIWYRIVAEIFGNKTAYLIFNRIAFIGVFHHELSHALLATLTGAKVKKIVFFKPEGDRLGYVEYSPRGNIIMRSIQNTMSSIAPVFCGAISVVCLSYILKTASLPYGVYIFIVYSIISIIIHMTMSSQDFRIMWKGIPIVSLIIFVICIIFKISFF
jgi:hypothetical protein